MSLDPEFPLPPPPLTVVPPPPPPLPQPRYNWFDKLSALVYILFCMTLGTVLLLFPWTEFWDHNLFSSLVPEWHNFWDNSYVRGGVSGLGVVNFYVAFLEIIRLRRFAGQSNDE